MILILIPLLLVTVAGVLFQRSLQNSQTPHWQTAGVSLVTLILLGLLLGYLASLGSWGGVGATLLSGIAGVAAVAICVWLVCTLPRWRKLASLGFVAATALVILTSWNLGNYHSPEAMVERNAEIIVQALEEYYTESGMYPAVLDDLVPTYLPTLPEAVTTQGTGWLYESTNTTYTLGYWMWPEKYGVWLCLYSSSSKSEECHPTGYTENSWEPFLPVYTPMAESDRTP